jgi:UDP-3-O-[3-hydroxymyristoyl] N-acetylglucosamine deacetylase
VTTEVIVEGMGLHTGAPARAVLRAWDGPVCLGAGGRLARIDELRVASTARATTVEACDGALRVGTVEHAFAALAGLGIHEGVRLEVDGPELPLLDGCASAWCDALLRMGLTAGGPRLRVERAAVLEVGPSSYEFEPDPGDGKTHVEVRLELDDPRVDALAVWSGGADDFRTRIAPARTFATAKDLEELSRRGLARHVPPTAVVLLAPDAILSSGRPFARDEPARHKLLDLLGDLYLHGGPALGHVRASRPGHVANARAFARAREQGILVRC